MEFDYVYTDVETTGLDPTKDEIVEVVAIEFNMSGVIGKRVNHLCRPMSGFIPSEATAVHGISYSDVKDKPTYLRDGIREEIAKFIGPRTLVGHNINEFDIKFLKVKPMKTEDSLEMCRARYGKGGNKLKAACKRMGISWDDKEAHRAEYDAEKGIELFIKLKTVDFKQEVMDSLPLFNPPKVNNNEESKKLGIIPSNKDKELLTTQSYSYSRISLYHQCPYKWFMRYVRGLKEPDYEYFKIGKVCHKVAELSGQWCFRQSFINKFSTYYERKEFFIVTKELSEEVASFYKCNVQEVSIQHVAGYLYDYSEKMKEYTGKGLAAWSYEIDQEVKPDEYERPSMPDRESYDKMIQDSLNQYKCNDGSVASEVNYIMNRFYGRQNFSLLSGEVTVTERYLAFDKDWKLLKDFYSYSAFFRGIIDVIHFYQDYVIILDYKTSRTMMTQNELKQDMQLKCYVLLLMNYLPPESVKRLVIKVNYIRFGVTIEHEIVDPKSVAKEAEMWISQAMQDIEKEMLKTDGTSFPPNRNEYCHSCYLAEDGKCPLFDKKLINQIDDVENFIIKDPDDCATAWKRIEANKFENQRLSKICKAFIEDFDGVVRIDGSARLDFYTEIAREFDSAKTLTWLLENGVDINYAIKFFTISPSSLESIMEKKDLEMKIDKLNELSKEKRKTKFDAMTEKQAFEDGYINASFGGESDK